MNLQILNAPQSTNHRGRMTLAPKPDRGTARADLMSEDAQTPQETHTAKTIPQCAGVVYPRDARRGK